VTLAPQALAGLSAETFACVMVQAGAALTVTLKLQLAVLPAGSVAVHVTACGEPLAEKLEPEGVSQLTLTCPLLSVAVGLYVTTAPAPADGSVAVMSPGQEVNEGASVSLTVTTKLQLSPVESVVVTTVVPIKKKEPEAWSLVAVPQLPLVEAGEVKLTNAPSLPGSLLTGATLGQLSVQAGGVGFEASAVTSELLLVGAWSSVSLVTVAVSVNSVPLPMVELTW
jgi:hypothetical protein